MAKSSQKRRSDKPAKPYPDFPLFAHATKRWAKKILGRMVYFGPWSDPQAALDKYLEQKDYLHAGRRPVDHDGVFTVETLVNKFLAWKRHLVDTDELSPRTLEDYHDASQWAIDSFGWNRAVSDLRPDEFEKCRVKMSKSVGLVRLGKLIQCVRMIFKWADDQELVNRPVRFGQAFKRPSKKTMRLYRAKQGSRMFEGDEIRRMLAGISVVKTRRRLPGLQLRAMILLGINCGFGNADCGTLPITALDLDRGWVNFPRPKTGISRRCKFWPETVAAVREVLAKRPAPKDEAHDGLVFITKYGQPWAKNIADNTVSKEMAKLLRALDINGHRNFYALRHTFETIGGAARDQVAVDAVMGHADDSMAAHYRERIDDDRLEAVANHVRTWLWQHHDGGRFRNA